MEQMRYPEVEKTKEMHPCFFLSSYHRVMARYPEVKKTKEMHTYIHFFLILTTGWWHGTNAVPRGGKNKRNAYIHPFYFFNSYHRVIAWNKCGTPRWSSVPLTRRHAFSKMSRVLACHSEFTRALSFENFWQDLENFWDVLMGLFIAWIILMV